MGIFDIFKSNNKTSNNIKEIGNLNCINIGGKFDTGYKVDNKELFKYLKERIKKDTLKNEFSSVIKDKTISDTVNEIKAGSAGSFFVPRNLINDKDYEKIMGFKIIDKTLIILNIQNDQEWWSKKINYNGEVRSISMQIVELDNDEYNLLKPFEKKITQGKNKKFLDTYFKLYEAIFGGLFKTEKRKKYPINSFVSLVGFRNQI